MNNGSCHVQGTASTAVQGIPFDVRMELADVHLRKAVADLVLMEVHWMPFSGSFVDPFVARLGSTEVL